MSSVPTGRLGAVSEPSAASRGEPVRERHLDLPNLFNLRDLGGYRTADGRTVAWRRLFRADGLQRLTGPDVQGLVDLGVRTVIDLRRPEEVATARFTAAGVTYHHESVLPTIWEPASYDAAGGAARFLADRYLEMTSERGAEIGRVLHVIADPAAVPLAFHCAAGKDRTGVVAAITLSLMGVPDDDIAEDYSLSELAIPRWQEWAAEHRPELLAEISRFPEPWHTAPPEAIHLLLAALRAEYGGVEQYAAGIGVGPDTVAHLRANLLDT
jgi:protein tyrosine/serine phosphatase